MNKEEFEKAVININNSFGVSREIIGATNSHWKLLPKKLSDISSRFIEEKPISLFDLKELKSQWLSEDPLIDENGDPFVFYIHDFRGFRGAHHKRVFHVAWCHTLEDMMQGGRKERYVRKGDLSNNDFFGNYGSGKTGHERLPACNNCEKKMRKKIYPRELYYDRHNLDIIKFFKIYGKQDLLNMDNPFYSVDYPEDWAKISKRTKQERGNKCEICGSPYRLETHHLNGNLGDIRSENLKVLCYTCHTKQPFHQHMPV